MLHNVRVTLDGYATVTAHAVNPGVWNGFAAPYFTREQADDLAAQLAAIADPQQDETISYRAECPRELDGPTGDGYLHDSPQYDGDERWAWTGGQKVPGDPDGPTVYAIGAYGWIWTLVE